MAQGAWRRRLPALALLACVLGLACPEDALADPPSYNSVQELQVEYGQPRSFDQTPWIIGVATSVNIVTPPAHGSLTASGLILTFTPDAGYSGSDSCQVSLAGPDGTSAVYPMSIKVGTPVVFVPASGSTVTLTAGTASYTYFTPSGGLYNGAYTLGTSSALPDGMTVSSNSLTGTPTTPGIYSLVLPINEPFGGVLPQSFQLTIVVQPKAGTGTATIPFGMSGTVDLSSKISGGTLVSLTAAVSMHGVTPVVTGPTSISYTSKPGFYGSDKFTYTVTVAEGTSGTGNVLVVINPPVIGWVSEALPDFLVGVPYNYTLSGVTSGTTPYTYVLTSGSLPPGISMSSSGVISGTPTTAGNSSFGIKVTDSSVNGTASSSTETVSGKSTTKYFTVTTGYALPVAAAASASTAYNTAKAIDLTASISGGAATSVGVATQPAHGTATASGMVITYTPATGYNGPDSFTYLANGVSGSSAPAAVDVTVGAPTLILSPAAGSLSSGRVGLAYSQSSSASGGQSPYTFAVSAGSLPPGLALASTGALSGTPSVAGTYNFSITATDSSTGTAATQTAAYTLTVIEAAPIALPATATTAYNTAKPIDLTAKLAGGPTTSLSVASGPSHGTTSVSGMVITYTPTSGYNGTDSFTYAATGPGGTSTAATVTITIGAPALTLNPAAGSLTSGQAGSYYSNAISCSGGASPYTYAVTSGSLPAGLALSSAGALSGTPGAAGTYSFSIKATDSSTGTAATQTAAYSLLIIEPAPNGLSASVSTAYNTAKAIDLSGNISGGPATSVNVASPPAHGTATASGMVVTYTPATGYNGADSFTYTATGPGGTSSATTVTITVGAPTLTLSPSAGSLTAGQVSVAYSLSFSASGGASPYTYAMASGSLPPGLSLASTGALSGTPSTAGAYSFSVKATDSSTGTAATQTVSYSLGISEAVPIAAAASASTAYNTATAIDLTAKLTGGPATSVSVASPPAHGTATASGKVITYTPTTGYNGPDSFSYTATGPGGTSAPATVTVTVGAPTLTLSPSAGSLTAGQVSVAYSLTFSASGGASPYTYAVASGSLPAGLALSSAGALSGTPGAAGTYSFSIKATDSSTGTKATQTVSYSLGISEAAPVAGGIGVNTAYNTAKVIDTSPSLGGGPVTSVSVVSPPSHGTATASGKVITYTPASGYNGPDSFSYTANGPGGTSAPATVNVTVGAPSLAITPTTLKAGEKNLPYSQTLKASGGLAPYTFALASGSLPPGVALSSAGLVAGKPTESGAYSFGVTVTDSSTGTTVTLAATISLTIGKERDNPTKKSKVRGLVNAQTATVQRYAVVQISNFTQRMASLHNDGWGANNFNLNFALPGKGTNSVLSNLWSAFGKTLRDDTPQPGTALKQDVSMWAEGELRLTHRGASRGSSSYDVRTDGISMGVDLRLNDLVSLGIGMGQSLSVTQVEDEGTKSTGTGAMAAIYGTLRPGKNIFVDGLAGFGVLSLHPQRTTDTGEVVSAGRDGNQFFASVTAGYEYALEKGKISPYGRLDWARANLASYSEFSVGTDSLRYEKQSVSSFISTLGVRADTTQLLDIGMLAPRAKLELQHHVDRQGDARMSYLDLGTAGPTYVLQGNRKESNEVVGEVGCRLTVSSSLWFSFDYGRSLYSDERGRNQTFRLRLEHTF